MASNTISILIQAKDQASKTLQSVTNEMEQGAEKSGKFGKALGKMREELGHASKVASVAGAAAAAAGTAIGLNFNSSVEQAETKLRAFMKDGKLVAETLAWVKNEAAETQFSFTDMADAAANLTPVAKSSGQSLKALVQQAEILAAINPTEGLTGATFSLREALSGDWVSIIDRFNLPRTRINELKDQGVPAMEIISRTLQEMGIDYSLVAEQGKTAAARFDQIKDKLTMMAGAASKPLFDKLSEGLNSLNEVDFTEFGNRMADAVETAIEAGHNIRGAFELFRTGDFSKGLFAGGISEDSKVVAVILDIRKAFVDAWNFIRPAVEELGQVFRQHLLPALQEFWKQAQPVLKDLAIMHGVTIVAAVYVLIKALSAVAFTLSFVLKVVSEGMRIVRESVQASIAGIIAAWQAVTAFFAGIPGFFANLWSNVVSGVQNAVTAIGNWFAQLPGRIVYALGFAAGWLTSFVTVDIPNFINSAISWFSQLPGRVGNAVSQMFQAVSSWFSQTGQDMSNKSAQAVASVGDWFRQLPGRVAQGARDLWNGTVSAFNGFKDRLINWANDTVNGVIERFTGLPGRITNSVQSALNSAQSNVNGFFNDIGAKMSQGFQVGSKRAIGTAYAPGGLTLVGENGPELVNLPRGSQVTQAYRTRNELAQEGAGGVTNILSGNFTFQNAESVQAFFDRLDKTQRLAKMGMAS
jgi:hypothetical protein